MKLSIRTKLAVSFTLIFTILLCFFSGVIYYLLSTNFEKELKVDSLHSAKEILLGFSKGTWEQQMAEMPEESREFNVEIKLLDPEFKNIYLSDRVKSWDWPVEMSILQKSIEKPVWSNEEINGISHLILTKSFTPAGKKPHYLQIARSRADINRIKNQLIYCINIGTPLILIIALFSGQYFSKKALDPVERIRRRAQTIKSDNLHERLIYDGPSDELSRLTSTLNDLLSRIQDAFIRLKRFTADASHELRIPLAGIRGTLEVGLRKNRTAEEAREIMETAFHESERMSELVVDLLSLARSDAGEMKLEKTEVDLEPFFKTIFDEAKTLNAEKKVQLHLGSIPAGKAVFDEVKVHQLLINLIENAIRYNKPRGDVTLSAETNNGNLAVFVKDTGIGISKEDQDKIFDRFYRVDKARSRAAGGTGLGLPIALSIAQAHNGSINVDSVVNRGSTFRLTIPILPIS